MNKFILAFGALFCCTHSLAQSKGQLQKFFHDFAEQQKIYVPLCYGEVLPLSKQRDIVIALASNKISGINYEENNRPFTDSLTLTE